MSNYFYTNFLKVNYFFNNYSNAVYEKSYDNYITSFGYWQLEELFIHLGYENTLEITDFLYDVFQPVTYPKNSVVVKEGQTINSLIFIVQGSVQVTGNNGQIVLLLNAGNLICTGISRFSNITGGHTVTVIKDSTALVVNPLSFKKFLANADAVNVLSKIHKANIDFCYKLIEFNKMAAGCRVEAYLKHFPELFEDFKSKDIAKFMGLKPETLSRVMSIIK